MNQKIPLCLLSMFFMALIVVSCGSIPRRPLPEKAVVERPIIERPLAPEHIMGKGQIPQEKLARFLEQNNPEAERDFIQRLAGYYIEESAAEGVNYDVAFVQMCLETGFLRYGGLVTPDMNNFCGLGSTGIPDAYGYPERGLIFPEPRTGVRAHIQHLQAYADVVPLSNQLVDPRYGYVRRGSSPTIHGLAGTWAADRAYSEKLAAILERLYNFAYVE